MIDDVRNVNKYVPSENIHSFCNIKYDADKSAWL